MANYAALKAELAKPAYTGLSDVDAAALMNTPGSVVPSQLPMSLFMGYLTKTGIRVAIQAGQTSTDLAVSSMCLGIIDLLRSNLPSLDLTNSSNVSILSAFVAKGLATQAQADAMVAMGSAPGPSVAVNIFTVAVTDHDINFARAN